MRYEALGGAISDVKGETEAIKKGIRMALGMLATIMVSLIAAARPTVVAQAPQTVGLALATPVSSMT